MDYKKLLLIIGILLLASATAYAGKLTFSTSFLSNGEPVATVSWGQGCYNTLVGGTGPNKCAAIKPYYCPVDSTGGNNYTQNGSTCGCPSGYQLGSGGTCVQCQNPCNPNPCTTFYGNTTCTVQDACAGTYTCSRGLVGYMYGNYIQTQFYTGETPLTGIPTPTNPYQPFKNCWPSQGTSWAFTDFYDLLGNVSRLCSTYSSISSDYYTYPPMSGSTKVYLSYNGQNGGHSNSTGGGSGGGSGSTSCTGSGKQCPPGFNLACINGVYHCI